MKNNRIKVLLCMITILIVGSNIGITYADYYFDSSNVGFDKTNTTLAKTNVQEALDEIYGKCSNIAPSGECPEGYNCTQLNKVTYNANGGSFSGNSTNDVYYDVVDTQTEETVTKYSHTSNINDTGKKNSDYGNGWTNANITGTDRGSTSQAHVIKIDGAEKLTVDVYYNGESTQYDWVSIWSGSHPTYTAYNNYSSTGYVAQKLGGSQSGSYTVNGNSLTNMGHSTYTITGDTVTFGFRSDGSGVGKGYGYYAKVIATVLVSSKEVTKEQGEYSVPTKTKETFIGWTKNEDGSGTVYKTEEDVKNMLDTENKEVVLYAKYKSIYICRRATTLHTETCSQTSTSNYCSGDGYTSTGSKGTSTITYGQLGTTGNTPLAGDAFDCDVNDDGYYNSTNERFYYVSYYFDTITQTFDNDYFTFLFYTNDTDTSTTPSRSPVEYYMVYNSSTKTTTEGPSTAVNRLPSLKYSPKWRDGLIKTRTRNILMGSNVNNITEIVKSNFQYKSFGDNLAARFLTMQELLQACPGASTNANSLDNCLFLFERTLYANPSFTSMYGYWLESAYDNSRAWAVSSSNKNVSSYTASTSSANATRIAIEIPKEYVQY